MIGRAELALVKPGAILINTARGRLLDENALADALRQAAGLAERGLTYSRPSRCQPRARFGSWIR